MTDTTDRYNRLEEQRIDVVCDHLMAAYKELTGKTMPQPAEEKLFEFIKWECP